MIDGPLTTAEDFIDQRFEMPEGGQWSELLDGKPQHLQPPEPDHGNAVLNLSKALADYLQRTKNGYACFDLGLRVATCPDSVLFPAACVFVRGKLFAESDKEFTDETPAVVMELSSTDDRTAQMNERIEYYRNWGVNSVWVLNPCGESLEVHSRTIETQTFQGTDSYSDQQTLEGFSITVLDLFREPDWWTGK